MVTCLIVFYLLYRPTNHNVYYIIYPWLYFFVNVVYWYSFASEAIWSGHVTPYQQV